MRDTAPERLLSVKLGAVGLAETYINSDPPKQKQLRALRGEVQAALEMPARELRETVGSTPPVPQVRSAIGMRFGSARSARVANPKARSRPEMKSK